MIVSLQSILLQKINNRDKFCVPPPSSLIKQNTNRKFAELFNYFLEHEIIVTNQANYAEKVFYYYYFFIIEVI